MYQAPAIMHKLGTPVAIQFLAARKFRAAVGVNQAHKYGVKGRLLVVDDEPAVRLGLERALRSEGYEVISAADFSEAKERLLEWPVDLLLLDLNLSGDNGWESYKQSLDLDPALCVVIITARPELAAPALAEGVTVLEKPLDVSQLVKTIDARLTAKPVLSPMRALSEPQRETCQSVATEGLTEVGTQVR
jgi:two-component system, response regulator, stage 0 sporulation protein F